MIVLEPHGRSSKEVPVSIVGGLDVHRRQITFDWVDRATGQAQRGQVTPATRDGLGRWLAQLPDHHGAFAVEACTGWRFVVEELQAAGWQAYLAEPAETATLRGSKRRAKTDRTDAQLLRELLEQGRLPQAWIPPAHLLELRVLVRLRKTLVDERTAFKQRLHAVLFHHGLPCPDHALLTQATRGWLEQVALPAASRLQVTTALRQIDQLDLELDPLERWLRAFARRQPGCRALIANHYGIGMLIAPTLGRRSNCCRVVADRHAWIGWAARKLARSLPCACQCRRLRLTGSASRSGGLAWWSMRRWSSSCCRSWRKVSQVSR